MTKVESPAVRTNAQAGIVLIQPIVLKILTDFFVFVKRVEINEDPEEKDEDDQSDEKDDAAVRMIDRRTNVQLKNDERFQITKTTGGREWPKRPTGSNLPEAIRMGDDVNEKIAAILQRLIHVDRLVGRKIETRRRIGNFQQIDQSFVKSSSFVRNLIGTKRTEREEVRRKFQPERVDRDARRSTSIASRNDRRALTNVRTTRSDAKDTSRPLLAPDPTRWRRSTTTRSEEFSRTIGSHS